MSLPIETQRLRLRKYEDKDLADILEYSSDADFWLVRNLDWPVSEAGVKAYWEAPRDVDPSTDPQWFSLVVELKAEVKVIGDVGSGVIKTGEHRQGTVGWLLGRKYQRRGLATEAARALLTYGFERLGLHRITARTGKDNRRSWYLMERLGMRREAHFRESHVVEGEWCDEFIYAVLADEWRAKQGQQIGYKFNNHDVEAQVMTITTFIALLRGINVGGHNKIPMLELRTLCADLGWSDVQSYIQSGNLVFKAVAPPARLEAELERAIERRFGLSIPVIVRAAADWQAYLNANPYPGASQSEPNLVMLVLSKSPPEKEAVKGLRERAANDERIVRVGDAIWIHYPGGAGRSKLSPALLDRLVGSSATARNWRTVLKLDELARRP